MPYSEGKSGLRISLTTFVAGWPLSTSITNQRDEFHTGVATESEARHGREGGREEPPKAYKGLRLSPISHQRCNKAEHDHEDNVEAEDLSY